MSTELLIVIATLSKAAELLLTTHAQGRDPTPEELAAVDQMYRSSMDGLLARTAPKQPDA